MLKTFKQRAIALVAGVSLSAFFAIPLMAEDDSLIGTLIKRKTPEQTILENLRKARPEINFGQPRKSPIEGLYQVQVAGGPLLYVNPEGDKLIAGEMFAIEANGFARVEDPVLIEERKKALAGIDPAQSVIFKPKGKSKAVVYVFTDIDCGYCRRLHSQIHAYEEGGEQKPGYNDLGIEIRYLAYPRAGIPSPSADKLVSVWCSKDKQDALTKLKQDQPVPMATCDNPVAAQFQLGAQIGVNGTPALFLPNGKLMPGYLPPADLAKELGI